MNTYGLEYYDLERLIKALGYDDFTATVVADYLDECSCECNLTGYLWNVLPYMVEVFDKKEDVLKYVNDEGLEEDDYTLYKCDNLNGWYLERG